VNTSKLNKIHPIYLPKCETDEKFVPSGKLFHVKC